MTATLTRPAPWPLIVALGLAAVPAALLMVAFALVLEAWDLLAGERR
jgi:hypothetical protein